MVSMKALAFMTLALWSCGADQRELRATTRTRKCVLPNATHVRITPPHSYTDRGKAKLLQLMPPFLQLKPRAGSAWPHYLLELGCGEGKALMELQSELPETTCICTNKRGYGRGQANSVDYLVKVAQAYKIPIHCDPATGRVILPSVELTDGVQAKPLPFPLGSIDVVVSAHALNQGKLRSYQSRCILPRLVPLLDAGGQVSVMLLFNIAGAALRSTVTTETGNSSISIRGFHVMRMLRFVEVPATPSSVVAYTVVLYTKINSVGLYVKRCSSTKQAAPDPFWGCIEAADEGALPTAEVVTSDLNIYETKLRALPPPLSRARSVAIRENNDLANKLLYSRDYLANIVLLFDRIEKNPLVLMHENL